MDVKTRQNQNIFMSIFLIIFGIIMVVLATMKIINYIVASIFLCVSFLVPFFVVFERSRIKCKMIVLIATLSALAIVGRWAFAWLPNVTLSTGIVILSGVCLGPIAGFMVGATTMLVSNMILGQGLWTIWQMLVTALVGLFASLFKRADKIVLMVYAVFVGFAYGFVMDILTLITMYNEITWQTFLVVWGASFYFDLMHAISSAVTVLLFYNIIVPTIRRKLANN